MYHSEAVGVTVEFEVQVPEHARESAIDRLQSDVDIGIEKDFARPSRDSLAGADPFLRPNVCETEVEPFRAFKTAIGVFGDVPIQRLGGSIFAEPEAADQPSRVRKLDHRKLFENGMPSRSLVDRRHEHL
jgi:hypothetical protein